MVNICRLLLDCLHAYPLHAHAKELNFGGSPKMSVFSQCRPGAGGGGALYLGEGKNLGQSLA